MRRARRRILAAAAIAAGLLAVMPALQRWERCQADETAARLQRQAAVAQRVIADHQRRLSAVVDGLVREPAVRAALRSGRLDEPARQRVRDLAQQGLDWVWLGDARGQRLASLGAEPLAAQGLTNLLAAARQGRAGQGLLPDGVYLHLAVVAPVPSGDRRRPLGVVAAGRHLDQALRAEIEAYTGGALTVVPHAGVLSPLEARRAAGSPSTNLPQVARRADHLLESWVVGHDPTRDIVFQQYLDPSGEPAGLIALSLPGDRAGTILTLALQAAWLALCLLLVVALSGVLLHGWHEARLAALARAAGSRATLVGPLPPVASPQVLRQLAESLNHHLNNALAVIIGNLEVLHEEAAADGQAARLDDILLRSWEASTLVRRFQKACFRDRLPRVREVDLGEACREALARLADRGEDTRRVRAVGLDGRLVAALAGDLVELLVALLENSLAATGADGRVEVRAERVGHGTRVVVADDGEGMSPEVLQRCAELFYTTRGPQVAGLGLAMVDSVIARHGGRWRITSAPGAGCVVTLELPGVNEATAPAELPAPGRPHLRVCDGGEPAAGPAWRRRA